MLQENTQDKIYASALAIYNKKGKEGTTFEEIAKHAQIDEILLKRNYEKERDIFLELFEEHFEHILQRYEPSHIFDDVDLYFEKVIEACKFYNDDDIFYNLYVEFFDENIKKNDYKYNLIMIFESTAQVITVQLEHFKKLGLIKANVDLRAVSRGIVASIDGMMWHRGVFDIENEFYEKMLQENLMSIANGIKS